jgi:hypothetical protein
MPGRSSGPFLAMADPGPDGDIADCRARRLVAVLVERVADGGACRSPHKAVKASRPSLPDAGIIAGIASAFANLVAARRAFHWRRELLLIGAVVIGNRELGYGEALRRRPGLDARRHDPSLHRGGLSLRLEPDEDVVDVRGLPSGERAPAARPGNALRRGLELGAIGRPKGIDAMQAGGERQFAKADLVTVEAAASHGDLRCGRGPTPPSPGSVSLDSYAGVDGSSADEFACLLEVIAGLKAVLAAAHPRHGTRPERFPRNSRETRDFSRGNKPFRDISRHVRCQCRMRIKARFYRYPTLALPTGFEPVF